MTAILSSVFGIIELLLGLRFFFLLFGADPAAFFVAWVYDLSAPLVLPFAGIFGQTIAAPGAVVQSVVEPSTLVALIVYAAIGGILIRLLSRSG